MRHHHLAFTVSALFLLAGVTLTGPAHAQELQSGSYTFTADQISNSCSDTQALALPKGTLTLKRDGKQVAIEMPNVAPMKGKLRRGGKLRVSAKGKPSQSGDARQFSASGRATETTVKLVFISELYRGTKPICTQSWDVVGKRK